MPKQPVNYAMDRVLGRCEKCGRIDNPRVVDIYKKGTDNIPSGYSPDYHTRHSHRLQSRMFCGKCLNDDLLKGFLEKGEIGTFIVYDYISKNKLKVKVLEG